MFQHCLNAPNYTVFSNTTSAGQWNLDHPGEFVVPLEQPHNDIHLSVGGFDIPDQNDGPPCGQIAGANGDMGENNTAALDPIFFFHHCNIDRMFWLWQKQHGCTDYLDILKGYAGTNSSDSQGPTPSIPPGMALNLETPLYPFLKDELGTPFTSQNCINIEKQLGYTYGPGSLENPTKLRAVAGGSTKKLTVKGINRALFEGSFVIRTFATLKDENGKKIHYFLGSHSVLSRRDVVRCANCLTHLEVVAHFPLYSLPADKLDQAEFSVSIQHRGSTKRLKIDKETALNEVALVDSQHARQAQPPEKLQFSLQVID